MTPAAWFLVLTILWPDGTREWAVEDFPTRAACVDRAVGVQLEAKVRGAIQVETFCNPNVRLP